MQKMVLISGGAAVGKTTLLKNLLPLLKAHAHPCVCKVDCLDTQDHLRFTELGIPAIAALSEDICPDHFLASNLPELLTWADGLGSDLLLIETAGLCHRCSPATQKTLNICVLDSTASVCSPKKLGPMLTKADFIVLAKIDLISQAEREILCAMVRQVNQRAKLFPVDGLCGYGIEFLADEILAAPAVEDFEGDLLRCPMPAGVCSYCIGEQRIGKQFQQGVVKKIII